MTDSELDEIGKKVVIMFDHIMNDLGININAEFAEDVSDEYKIKLVMDAMTASGLSFLNYIQAPSERGVENA